MTKTGFTITSLDEFPLTWRITDERWDNLPISILSQLQPLASADAQLFAKKVAVFRQMGPFIPKEEVLKVKSSQSLVEETIEHSAGIQHWFASLPIRCDESVYVHWSHVEPTALITTWSLFRSIWNSLWYPFDSMEVFDETGAWAVLLGQEELAWFMEA